MSADVELEAVRTSVLAALAASDLDAALRGCLSGLAILSMIPDSEIGKMSSLSWNRTAISSLMAELIRQGAAVLSTTSSGSCGLDVCEVQYVGVRSSDCGGGCSC